MIIFLLLLLLGLLLSLGVLYFKKNPQFGAQLSAKERDSYRDSPQWKGAIFENGSKTTIDMSLIKLPGLLTEFVRGRNQRAPKDPIPVHEFKATRFLQDREPTFIWYGHSCVLLRISGKTILIDPMFGSDASPVGPLRTKRFSSNTLSIIDTLPEIDVILMTHDHYDHLDYKSILKLKDKTKSYYVALGLSRHLQRWGIPKDRITEFDWWDAKKLEELDIVFTPSRHFSGRGFTDRAKSLWGGWIIRSNTFKIFWSGDGGYDEHFKEIGEKFGPFDWGFMECGQYNERWRQIHMFPEEAVTAAMDARVKRAIPVHWGAFSLALHTWKDPVERFVSQAKENSQDYICPELGEPVTVGHQATSFWWAKI